MQLAWIVKRLLRQCGIEARRYGVQTSADAQLSRILKHLGIDLVLDIGAHEGQYALGLRGLGYRGRIVSFEPQAIAHARLLANSRRDPKWEVGPRMALGDSENQIDIYISGHSLSSSILQMLPLHESAVPGSSVVGIERAPIGRLDRVAVPYLGSARSILLKIDTQGYEAVVLDGAKGVLDRVLAIQIELSMVPLYRGQPLMEAMRQRIEDLGFSLFALFPGHVHEGTGQTLQLDGLFVRRESLTPG